MSTLWLPPSTRRFDDEIEAVIATSGDPAQRRAQAELLHEAGFKFPAKDRFGDSVVPDSAVLLFARRWAQIDNERGERPLGAFVESDVLERMILDGNLHYENAGVVDWVEHQVLNALCPALIVQLREFRLFCPIAYEKCPAPDGWLDIVKSDGFALAIDQANGAYLYLSTGPLHAGNGLVLPAASRSKPGRNQKCPCGSGLKFKKCCG